ncbi:MAG: glutamate--tRNA ligase, partial [Dongiaceae bacterium]
AAQIQLFGVLGASPPAFAHLPLLTDAAGAGLSKRLGSLSIASLRDSGIEAMAIASYLAHLGTSDAIEPKHSLDDLAQGFDLGKFGRAAPKFDPAELQHLSARLLHDTPFAAVSDRLAALGLGDVDAALWGAARGNIAKLADIAEWRDVCRGAIAPVIEDAEFGRTAAALLPPAPWDAATWGRWTDAVKAATGRRGKELFRPLRLALTGCEHGPEMKGLLPLIGPARAAARLRSETA